MRNMNVGGSLTISLIVEGKLWGLIAGHHHAPRFLSPTQRELCDLYGQMVSMHLAARLQNDGKRLAERSKEVLNRLAGRVRQFDSIIPALLEDEGDLLALTGAHGAVVWRDGQASPVGVTPPLPAILGIHHWVASTSADPIFFTDRLSERFQEAEPYADLASGILTLAISRSPDVFIFWFLPQMVQSADWAGDPAKSVEPVAQDSQIHPRRSFARWKQSIWHRSRSWLKGEIEAVNQLQTILQGQLARNAEQLQRLLPICSWCKNVRSEQDYWQQVEAYVSQHTDIRFTHGICPACLDKQMGVTK
jgi:light-regulated signal transduction histidine kinase (bacteriophytochrome)